MLNGISPWWWVVLALALGAVEMATMSFFLIWPGLAALAMAGILLLAPNMSGTLQIGLFAVLAVLFTFAGRYLFARFGDGGGDAADGLNNRATYLVGRYAVVLEFDNGSGAVEIDGIRWRAQWAQGSTSLKDSKVLITKADPQLLYVEAAKEPPHA